MKLWPNWLVMRVTLKVTIIDSNKPISKICELCDRYEIENTAHLVLHCTREIHNLDPQPHRYCMLVSTASAPRVTRCSMGLYWSRDLCSRETGWLIGWLGDVILSRSDSERQRNLMMQDQCPLPVYYSQIALSMRKLG